MMKKIGLLLATLTAFSAQADVFPKTEVDAYLMAMHSMAPVNAKYTIQYKAAVESSCKTKLSIEQLSSRDFANVVQALVSSETVDRLGLDASGGSLTDTLQLVGANINCSDLSAPYKAVLSDVEFNKKHQHLSKVLHTWDQVATESQLN
ncbi:TPA: hypothetical protein PMC78_000985 [Vibrio cholerae]|uniref:hypothetical protein n=1 Tax=Vibrio parahaemolyticus TaxID=670 RepID=UPI00235ED985|nr:hypothetical protein [Vibrio parahaemolyticus]HCH1893809.1 hypothetical protein [Vibrio parahaemolyticus]HDI3273408.1 hypothetical protein [Vibrio cholerae]